MANFSLVPVPKFVMYVPVTECHCQYMYFLYIHILVGTYFIHVEKYCVLVGFLVFIFVSLLFFVFCLLASWFRKVILIKENFLR